MLIARARVDTVFECIDEDAGEIGVGLVGVAVEVVAGVEDGVIGGGEVRAVACWCVRCIRGVVRGGGFACFELSFHNCQDCFYV